ncbi:putative S-adenosylmethionine-dependent methyltransferase (plasmid) [Pseudosulfitobacter pseudonitzschiae]|uniref:Putative S-adenosylmethionine-dependent methyltransferase n=1 Tax=Pseudosulfitobacter pseudonitzschiae TaxID=1402135 RepID=A0A221K6S2_9RHOB|nr:putative S-adenosylmethionine-dependent methyltransferase [Pseudosulfitobacter pseudonitzschiae]
MRPSGSERLETGAPDGVSKQAPRPKGDSVSVLKRLERYISAFFKLGRIERIAKQANHVAQQNADKIAAFSQDLRTAIREQTAWMEGRLAEHSLHDNELSRRLDRIMLNRAPLVAEGQPKVSDGNPGEISEGFALFLDTFYNRLENRFRGSQKDILNRLAVYQPDVEAAAIRTGGKPALDLGCGRGEWLELMRRLGIPASGVDLNAAQIAEAREAGLAVEELDALAALEKAEDDSLSVISAHHLIEHIPFRDVAWIAREALRVLAPGGLLIFETPNPRNVLVGATSFHNDPTHLRPLTDPALGVLFETAGFHPVETRFLHPHERLDEFLDRPGFDPELAHLLFGPQDLAMLGQKPRESA